MLKQLHENKISRVGFFPGCFSPPHKGHYMTAKQMGVENDFGFVIASDSCRDEKVTTDKMAAIWKIYLQAMGMDNVTVKIVSGSPVAVTYQAVNLLNNGELISKNPVDIHPDAEEIFNRTKDDHVEVSLYAGIEDFSGRYSAFFKSDVYSGKNVNHINKKQVGRYASGTETRATIYDIAAGKRDADTLRNFLPGPSAGAEFTGVGFLTSDQETQVVDILLA